MNKNKDLVRGARNQVRSKSQKVNNITQLCSVTPLWNHALCEFGGFGWRVVQGRSEAVAGELSVLNPRSVANVCIVQTPLIPASFLSNRNVPNTKQST